MSIRTISYTLKEILPIFILTNFFLVFLLMLEQLVELADLFFAKNVPFVVIAQTVVYLMPSVLSITLPLSCLFGTLIAFSRLSADSELVALRAIGASIGALLRPIILFGLFAGALCLLMNSYLAVKGTTLAFNNINKIVENISLKDLRENELYTDLASMQLYVKKKIDDFHFNDIVLIRTDDDTIVSAKTGKIFPTPDHSIEMFFYDGKITTIDDEEKITSINFDNMSINIPLNIDFADAIDSVATMSMSDLKQQMGTDKALAFELSKRLSMPATAIILAILGFTFGVFSSRTTKSYGVLYAILIAFIFNMLLLYLESSVAKVPVSPLLLAWVPNLVLLAILAFRVNMLRK